MTNIVIEAGPGCGKTTTLVKAEERLRLGGNLSFKPTDEQMAIFAAIYNEIGDTPSKQIIFLAMTNPIRDELKVKLPTDIRVQNFNQAGGHILYQKYGQIKLSELKGRDTICLILEKQWQAFSFKDRSLLTQTLRVIDFLKQELLSPSPESIEFVADKYGIEYIPNLSLVKTVMTDMYTNTAVIDHTDQMWRALGELQRPRYALAFVDECQDLSALRLELALRIARNVVFCGDPNQSINAFAGACTDAFPRIEAVCKLKLPLKTNFRNPRNIVDHANFVKPSAKLVARKTQIVPEININLQGLPDYLKKETRYNQSTDIFNSLPEEHLILGRTRAHLIKAGLTLFKANLPCKILTRGGEKALTSWITDYISYSSCKTLEALHAHASNDKNSILKKSKIKSYQLEICLTILELCEALTSLSEIQEVVEKLSTDSDSAFPLCTLHKSKGLERNYIYLLFPPIQSPLAKTDEEKEQEENLYFVGITRTTNQLVWVDRPHNYPHY